MIPTLRRDAEFRKFWAAQALSAFGARITREGLPLTAVLLSGAEPMQLGFLTALSTGPGVAVSLLVGGFVDRSSRRRILIAADLIRSVVLLSIPVAAWTGWLSMPQLYVVAAIVGAASVVFGIADNAYLPGFVADRDLLEANSKLNATESVAEIGGPALAGVLFQVFTAPVAVVFNVITYGLSAALLAVIRRPERSHAPGTGPCHTADVAAGIRATFGQPVAKAMFLLAGGASFFGSFIGSLYVLYAVEDLRLPPGMLGLTIAAGGAGSLLGASLVRRWVERYPAGNALLGATAGAALFSLLIPLAGGGPAMAMGVLICAQLIGDAMATTGAIIATTGRQQLFPWHIQARVAAMFYAGTGMTGILGAIGGGFLGSVLGVRETLFVASAGLILIALWGATTPLRGARMNIPAAS